MGALIALGLGAITTSIGLPVLPGDGGTAPWRPSQWSNPAIMPPVTITATDPITQAETAYVFDCVIRAEHTQRSEITLNPVQTGAAITDHTYIIPPTLVIQIRMSDSMQSYTIGQWASTPSRGVSTYQTLVALQAARAPMQVSTRLRTYNQMLIQNIVAPDDMKSYYGLYAIITFQEIITANIQISSSPASINDSTRPQTTASTVVGQTTTQAVPASITSQNNVDNSGIDLSTVPSVPGAGQWSSYPSSGLSNVIP